MTARLMDLVFEAWAGPRENSSFAQPGFIRFPLLPTAYAVGCILTPLRGYGLAAGHNTRKVPRVRSGGQLVSGDSLLF